MNFLKMKNNMSALSIIAGVIILLSVSSLKAQDKDPVILTVAGEEITKSEFLNVYQKNNVNGEVIDRKSLEEYMELYINFRLKVREAESLGMDTMQSFINELAGYRKQLAQPYLIDEKMNRTLLEEAYNRKKEDIRASHLLIKVDKTATPDDTLAAYKKVMSIRKQAIKGEDFGMLAEKHSDDLSARDRDVEGRKIKGNKGDLGYFTVFDMVYPFETGAYNTKVGEVSMPVRSDFGYHLIKVTDRKPALGRVQVAHILVQVPAGASQADSITMKAKVTQAYDKLKNGEDFAAVAKEFSDDKSTATKGGVLPWFGANRMIPEFIREVSKLGQIGEISQPFSSSFGWHIVKLLDRKEIGTFDDNLTELKQNLSRSDRAKKSEDALVSRIKDEYKFTQNQKAKNEFYKVVNDSVFSGKWNASQAAGLEKNMFTIGRRGYSQQDFAQWLATHQRQITPENIPAFVDRMFNTFVTEKLLEYEDSQLEGKYPEFKSLMQEYRDGILLFELTEDMIWSRASKDTVGLENYYEANKNNYMWGERADVSFYTLKSSDKKLIDNLKSSIKKGLTNTELLEMFNNDSTTLLTLDQQKLEKGENQDVDSMMWKKGEMKDSLNNASVVITHINDVIAPEPKKLNEARGIVTANYQDFLEKEWIKELRNKYPYKVNQEVLSSIN